MTISQTWNITGLILATVGVIGLFVFGAPFRVRGKGRNITFTSDKPNAVEESRDRWFDIGGWASLVIAVVGAACQIVGTLV